MTMIEMLREFHQEQVKEGKKMQINANLSLTGCWKMVNNIQLANSPKEIRERANIAEEWLRANNVIDTEQYDDLMRAVSHLVWESYRIERGVY